ncbi:MAG: SDR family NAD(P)-dependent oxidoreductase [Pseudomonadales bacterium]
MSKFSGKTAIITGGAEGIGMAIAKSLGAQKMNIVLADIDQSKLASASTELEQLGVPVLTVALDVSEESQWIDVANRAKERFKNIHMLVNNAGIGGGAGALESQSTKDWEWSINVNLMGVLFGAKAIVPMIKEHGEGGWLVNVGSMAGMGGVPYSGAYTATKSAVVALSESWAGELTRDGIHVAVLCPAFVQTRIHESERNRQTKYKTEKAKPDSDRAILNSAANAVKNGIDPSIVGERLVEALNQGEFYVFTHPNYRPVVQQRSKLIDEAFERSARSPLLKDIVKQKIDML